MLTQADPNIQPNNAATPMLRIEHLSKFFPIRKGFFNRTVGHIQAVNDVSLDIYPGETLGIVGESGCGKSTLGRCILQLLQPTRGHVWFDGVDLTTLSPKAMRAYRRNMQLVFQNPYSSLDPRMRISDTLAEPFLIHKLAKGPALSHEVSALLNWVGLPQSALQKYPHELSGGQRQRVGIARALALKPNLIVADEPVSALDVSVQAQILNLLMDLKAEFGLTYLFIAHNLSVVEYISDRVAVMYLGQVVELAPARQLYDKPLHPYSQALLSAIAVPDPNYDTSQRVLLQGDLPSPANPPAGCHFHTRCHHAAQECSQQVPQAEWPQPNHMARCLRLPQIHGAL